MSTNEKDILWNAYKAFLRYNRISNRLAMFLVLSAIVMAFIGKPEGSIAAGVIAFLAVFHAGVCRENARQLRQQVFNPENREA